MSVFSVKLVEQFVSIQFKLHAARLTDRHSIELNLIRNETHVINDSKHGIKLSDHLLEFERCRLRMKRIEFMRQNDFSAWTYFLFVFELVLRLGLVNAFKGTQI